jgi:hypothetical protein
MAKPPNEPNAQTTILPPAPDMGGARRKTWMVGLMGSSTLLVLLATGIAFGANKGCVSAPLHGASQAVVGASADTTTNITFSGQAELSTSDIWVLMGKISGPGTLDSASTVVVGDGPLIHPAADGSFSQTVAVPRRGSGAGGILWNDDDAVGFMLYEINKPNGYTVALLPTYQVNPGYSVTKHGIAAMSDRPELERLPGADRLGILSPLPNLKFEFSCSNASPLPDGNFKCPIPGEPFLNQLPGTFLSKKQLAYTTYPSDPTSAAGITAATAATAAANRYYAKFPAAAQFTTLASFKSGNGFNANVEDCKSSDPAVNLNGETCAWYRNEMDLGFGRQMHCKSTTGIAGVLNKLACYVTNFKNENDAFNNTPLLQLKNPATAAATVAMTWQNTTVAADKVRFYVYSQTGALVPDAALDGGGAKTVPGLCLNCHGGAYNPSNDTVTGTHFLPFDKVSLPTASARSDQAAALRVLNTNVYSTEYVGNGNAATPISELVAGWYNNFASGSTYNAGFVPAAWSENPALYLGVVAPYCRSCHTAQVGARAFTSLTDFTSSKVSIMGDICNGRTMPHSERTYQRFWESGAAAILATELGPVSTVVPVAGGAYEACKYKQL